MSRTTIDLIPWDAESSEQIDRLIEQRVACGWHADKVEGPWKDAQRAGAKCIYWLVIPKDDPNHASRMEQAYPILDTATNLRGTERHPTHRSFNPVGHISLDVEYPAAGYLKLDMPATGAIWIKALYVSEALQSSGLGRAAMDALEVMAKDEPLCATTLMLDTVYKKDQLREDFAVPFFGYMPKMSNEEWYSRRGYRVVKKVPGFYTEIDPTRWDISTVFMRRDLA